jgi:hypothetical protein
MTHSTPAIPAPIGATTQFTARLAAGFAMLAIVCLGVLRIVQPGLRVGDSMISQYAVGEPMGWLMNVDFGSFALASIFLFVGLVGQVKSIVGRFGLFFLLAAAFGLSCGGLFNLDPTTTQESEMSFSGRMHGFAFMIGVPGELLSVLLLSLAMRRQTPWKGVPLLIVAAIVWVLLVVMAVSLVGWMKAGATGPAYFGWPNRGFMIAYAVWIILAAWPLAQNNRSN